MQLRIVAHDAHFNQPSNSQRDYPSKISHDKTSAMRNVRILCANCPPPAITVFTQARSRAVFPAIAGHIVYKL